MKTGYDEISPFSGKLSVMSEYHAPSNDTHCICFDSGYNTYKRLWKLDSEYITRVEEMLPLHIIKDRKVDKNNNVWYRFIQIDSLVALIPEVEDDIWTWNVYRIMETTSANDPVVLQVMDHDNVINFTCDESSKLKFPDNSFERAFDALFFLRADIINKLVGTDGN